MKIKLALIGKDISHSRSPEVYRKILSEDVEYTLLDCPSSRDLPTIEDLKKYDGVSITSPYKRDYLDKVVISDNVRSLNAINCLSFSNGNFFGHNTDYGALKAIFESEILLRDKKVILLGNGAMANITTHLLKEMKIDFSHIYRSKDGKLENYDLSEYDVVLNSCARIFTFRGKLKRDSIFFDYNYEHPAHSKRFKRDGLKYVDGINLLYKQGKIALTYWKIK